MQGIYNIANKRIYKINNADYSPLLRTMLSTKIGLDKDEDGNIILNLDGYCLEQYLAFLDGNDFDMNDEISDIFHYFGHENTFNYSLDFWKVKLYDTWIRDNCYKLNLFDKDPYYGLYEISTNRIKNDIPTLPIGHYIAGEAALYLAGITKTYTNIDIFTDSLNVSEEWLKELLDEGIICYDDNCVILPDNRRLILRSYSCPSEIVHGFDVGSSGIIAEHTCFGTKFYCTRRALYSIVNGCNILEPDRYSDSYVNRLLKYSNRKTTIKNINTRMHNVEEWTNIKLSKRSGFKIILTGADGLKIDKDYYKRTLDRVKHTLYIDYESPKKSIGEVNLREVTLELYKYWYTNDRIDRQYKFMSMLYDNNIITAMPIPYIPNKDPNIYKSLEELYEKFKSIVGENMDDVYSKCIMKSVKNNGSKPTTIDELHPALDINVNALDTIVKLNIDDDEFGDIISFHSFIKNHPNPLAYIIRMYGIGNMHYHSDPASLLLLECVHGIGYLIAQSKESTSRVQNKRLVDINQLQWNTLINKEQCIFETIHDMKEWFSKSPLIVEEGIPVN